ncbi:hypothetical protein RRG08_058201 [Elysia crispata]|uniref:Uncharacterized protein n=1 Tax=Elysia crispata TaxID=231223 RepID=A0AAE1ANN1_9GAST|nr:hypothetical protein RRG08_058201 [Elysia crispata]
MLEELRREMFRLDLIDAGRSPEGVTSTVGEYLGHTLVTSTLGEYLGHTLVTSTLGEYLGYTLATVLLQDRSELSCPAAVAGILK